MHYQITDIDQRISSPLTASLPRYYTVDDAAQAARAINARHGRLAVRVETTTGQVVHEAEIMPMRQAKQSSPIMSTLRRRGSSRG